MIRNIILLLSLAIFMLSCSFASLDCYTVVPVRERYIGYTSTGEPKYAVYVEYNDEIIFISDINREEYENDSLLVVEPSYQIFAKRQLITKSQNSFNESWILGILLFFSLLGLASFLYNLSQVIFDLFSSVLRLVKSKKDLYKRKNIELEDAIVTGETVKADDAVEVLICGKKILLDRFNLRDNSLCFKDEHEKYKRANYGHLFTCANAQLVLDKHNKRLFSAEEYCAIDELPKRWDDELIGLWISFPTPLEAVIDVFFPANGRGHFMSFCKNNISGYYWSNTQIGKYVLSYNFDEGRCDPIWAVTFNEALSIRGVRDVIEGGVDVDRLHNKE